ncbi:MAG: MbnH family di-heme enzyme [Hyphomonadaceae bacterium]
MIRVTGNLAVLGLGLAIPALALWQVSLAQTPRNAVGELGQVNRTPVVYSDAYAWDLPAWVQPPPEPEANPTTKAKVELGRRLFYDGRLAADSMRSCASCHQQGRSFSDAAPFSWGVTGELTARNTMALANVGYAPSLTWANPYLAALELQARTPMFGRHPVEMGMEGRQDLLTATLAAEPIYRDLFASSFPDDGGRISLKSITAALGAFERTLVSARSPYDEYRFGGDLDAISDSAKRGEALFMGPRLKCQACHGGPRFNGDVAEDGAPVRNFQNNGLYNVDGRGGYPTDNIGLASMTIRPEDMGKFKVPSLRNISVTAPYMHDGSVPTLAAVLDHYAAGGRLIPPGERHAGDGRASPLKSPLITGFQLSPQEREDVLAFLNSLTDEHFLKDARFSDPWK